VQRNDPSDVAPRRPLEHVANGLLGFEFIKICTAAPACSLLKGFGAQRNTTSLGRAHDHISAIENIVLCKQISDSRGCGFRDSNLHAEGGWIKIDGIGNAKPSNKTLSRGGIHFWDVTNCCYGASNHAAA
jgi:hypothetical protein